MSSVNPPGRNTDTTKPRQQKETPQQRVRFCDRIRAAYKAFKAGQIMSDAFVSKAGEALDEEYQRLPVVAATKMDPEAVAKAFGLRWDQEPGRFIKEKPTRRGWMMPPNRIQFTHCFSESDVLLTPGERYVTDFNILHR